MSTSFDPYYEWLGIPPRDQPPNLYRLLGIELFESNPSVIEHAADRQMAHLRTFQSGANAEASQKLLNQIAKAKVILLDPQKKPQYDAQLRAKQQPPAGSTAAAPAPVVNTETPEPVARPQPLVSTSAAALATKSPASRVETPLWKSPIVLTGAAAGGLALVIGVVVLMMGGNNAQDPPDPNPRPDPIGPVVDPVKPRTGADTTANNNTPTFGVDNPTPPSTEMPDSATRALVANADGFVGADYALCQTLPLDEVEGLSRALGNQGFRLHRLRPYKHDGQLKAAALWHRDGRPWRAAINKTANDIRKLDAMLRKRGFFGQDVLAYDSSQKYCAVWSIPPAGGIQTFLTVDEASDIFQRKLSQSLTPLTFSSVLKSSEERVSNIWTPLRGKGHGQWKGSSQQLKRYLNQKKQIPLDFNVRWAPRMNSFMYMGVFQAESSQLSHVAYHLSPKEHLAAIAELNSDGLQPVSIAVGLEGRGAPPRVMAVSVWRSRAGSTYADLVRQKYAPGAPSTAVAAPSTGAGSSLGSHVLAIRGNGGVEVRNTQGLTNVRSTFTSEMWVRLAAHNGGPVPHSLMTTSSMKGARREGWTLWVDQRPSGGGNVRFRWTDSSGPKEISADGGVDFRRWRHVALFNEFEPGASWNTRVYVDGRMVMEQAKPFNTPTVPSTQSLWLGAPSGRADDARMYGAIGAYRLSSSRKYTRSFQPSRQLDSSADTLSALLFDRTSTSGVKDVSGGGRDGRLVVARWLDDRRFNSLLATVPPAAANASAPISQVPTVAVRPPGNPPVKPPVEVQRKALPGKAVVDAKIVEIRDVFKAEYKQATSPPAKLILAQALHKQAREDTDDNSKYALLLEAAGLAAGGRNLALSLRILDEIEADYEADMWTRRNDVITSSLRGVRSLADRLVIAQTAYDLGDQAVKSEHFAIAGKLFDVAANEGRRKDNQLARRANARSQEVKELEKDFAKATRAFALLKTNADDADANLAAGRYLCFVKNEWAEGLKHLSKGSDAALQGLASVDSGGGDAKAQLAIATQWHNHGKERTGAEATSSLKRAQHWYQLAQNNLKGLDRAKARNALSELEAIVGAVAPSPVSSLSFLDAPPGVLRSYTGHTDNVRSIDVALSGRYMASSDDDGAVHVWDLASGRSLHRFKGNPSRISSVIITPDEKLVLAGANRDGIGGWNIQTGQPAFGHKLSYSVDCMDISADGRKLVWGIGTSSKPNIGVMNFTKRTVIGVGRTRNYPRHLAISPDGSELVTCDSGGLVVLWNLNTMQPKTEFTVDRTTINDLSYAPNGEFVLITGSDEVLMWDPVKQAIIKRLKGTPDGVTSPRTSTVSPDSQRILIADRYGKIDLWNAADGTFIRTVFGAGRRSISLSNRPEIIRYLPDPRGFVMGTYRGELRLLRLPD